MDDNKYFIYATLITLGHNGFTSEELQNFYVQFYKGYPKVIDKVALYP